MKSLLFVFLTIFAVSGKNCSAQSNSLALKLLPNVSIGTVTNGVFELNQNQENFFTNLKSGYTLISSELVVEDSSQYLYVRYNKQNTTYLFGLEVVTLNSYGGGPTITNTCTGSCSDGVGGIITYCSSCSFIIKNGRITGCKCNNGGCCVHSISSTSSSIANPSDLKNYLAGLIN